MPRPRAAVPAVLVPRRRLAVPLALAVALLAGCTPTVGGPASGGPGLDADGLADLTAEVAGLPLVAEVWSSGSSAEGGHDAWTELTVRTDAPSATELAATATDIAALLPDDGFTTARVSQSDVPGVPDLAVEVAGGDADVPARLAALTDLASVADVTGVQLLPDSVSATTTDATGLPALAEAVRPLRVPTLMLGTADQRVTSYIGPGLLDARVAGLVARIDAWPGVTSQFVGDEGTGEAWVRVQVQGDDTVEGLADALGRKAWPQGAGVVHVVVSSSFREQGVVVGRPEPAVPGADDGHAAEVPSDGVPSCTATDLALRLTGFDAALGRRYLTVVAQNDSGAACTLEGRPGITFVRESGTPAPDVETGTPTGTAAPQRVVLQPGSAARSDLTWRGMSTALDPDVTVELRVVPQPGDEGTGAAGGPQGTEGAPLTVDGPGLDILAGAAVEIGAWHLAED